MLTIHDVQQGSPAWHALRLRYPHTASLAWVLLTKGKRAASNTQGSHGSGFWARRGLDLEPQAIEVYEDAYSCQVARPGFITNSRYKKCGWSPDGWIPGTIRIGLEIKSFKEDKHRACVADVRQFPEVYAQCQFGIMVGELDAMDLINFNPDLEDVSECFVVTRLYPDPILIERFKRRLAE